MWRPLLAIFRSFHRAQNSLSASRALGRFVSALGFTFEPEAALVSNRCFVFVLFTRIILVAFIFLPLHHSAGSNTSTTIFKTFCLWILLGSGEFSPLYPQISHKFFSSIIRSYRGFQDTWILLFEPPGIAIFFFSKRFNFRRTTSLILTKRQSSFPSYFV